tara:strand:+ start:294 stop:905 length:612 start_codon:yes stop_codon:yes gene_type:complete
MENKINRETWLNLMIDKAVPMFDNAGFEISEIRSILKVACGFPPNTRVGTKFTTLGCHINPKASASGYHEIYIHPETSDSVKVVDILIHELAHAMQTEKYPDAKQSHGKEFKNICKALTMTGNKKYKFASASVELLKTIQLWVDAIGKYPHAIVSLNANRKKQSTRNHKVECYDCKWSFRCSTKNIDMMTSQTCLACGSPSLV